MPDVEDQLATRVVVLAGPSGSGKSRLAARLQLPVLRLDDFYRDGDDPDLPHAFGIVDWDDPASWNCEAAVEATVTLCREGRVEVPRYDIPTSSAVGHYVVQAAQAPLVIAEGIFAAETIPLLAAAGVLADAIALTHRPAVTFARRLVRDLKEARKPPLTLLRRGVALMRAEPAIIARQVRLGATACSPAAAERRILALLG